MGPSSIALPTFVLISLAVSGCGAVVRDPGGGGECSERADDCSGDTICLSGTCEAAYPRSYDLSIDDVSLPSRDPNNNCWDIPCGPPDPYVVVRLDDRDVGATDEASDTNEASWSDIFPITLSSGSRLELQLYDSDVDNDDLALACSSIPIDTELLRSRFVVCGSRGSGSYLHATITPRN